MPQHIKHIDKIAREKQRDVLFIGLILSTNTPSPTSGKAVDDNLHLKWLQVNNIPHQPCGLIANENAMPEYRDTSTPTSPWMKPIPTIKNCSPTLRAKTVYQRTPSASFIASPWRMP
jgi:hypothetical protein